MNEGTCKTCGAKILWVKMIATGKANPLNFEPDKERGNVMLTPEGGGLVLPLGRAAEERDSNTPMYLSHFATCPQNKQHRKPA